ncbi:MAG: penicillin-binding protein 2 [Alphaproteobacteria bacterium]|nr:MAG: penicillin-binding protein 2 [Alphaproteobacteria bacterium]
MSLDWLKQLTTWHNPREQHPSFARKRIWLVFTSFIALYGLIVVRLFSFVLISPEIKKDFFEQSSSPRFDILDRNGELIATDIVTYSIYVDPKAILDQDETVCALVKALPRFTKKEILEKLNQKGRFIWVARHLDPELKDKIFNLGLSGVFVKEEYKRTYPNGALVSHIVGHCDIDNQGICGIERSYEDMLRKKAPVTLSLDLRLQHIVRRELKKGIKASKAVAGNALIMDQDGQLLSAVSLPDYHSDRVEDIKNTFNRNFQGVYEIGSVLKILNVAISLETGVVHNDSVFDARAPARIGRFLVRDFKAKNRILTLTEAFIYSSNIAMIEMANCYGDKFGIDTQRKFFKKLGLLDPLDLEVKELGYPIMSQKWTRATFQALAYGYGLAMPPISFLTTTANVLNNTKIVPSLIKGAYKSKNEERVFKPRVSKTVERLMREVVLHGSGAPTNIPGYNIIGKTGTALQCRDGQYDQNARNTTFVSCLIDEKTNRKFFILVMMEAPKPVEGTYGFATARWNCVPVTKKIIGQIAPILGVVPDKNLEGKYDKSI